MTSSQCSHVPIYTTVDLLAELQAEVQNLGDNLMSTVSALRTDLPSASFYAAQRHICEALLNAKRRVCNYYEKAEGSLGDERAMVKARTAVMAQVHMDRVQHSSVGLGCPVVSSIGFHGDAKDELRKVALNIGLFWTNEVARFTNTHIICKPDRLNSERAVTAGIHWGLQIVSEEWLWKSAAHGRILDPRCFALSALENPSPPAEVEEKETRIKASIQALDDLQNTQEEMLRDQVSKDCSMLPPLLTYPSDSVPTLAHNASRLPRATRRELGIDDRRETSPKRRRKLSARAEEARDPSECLSTQETPVRPTFGLLAPPQAAEEAAPSQVVRWSSQRTQGVAGGMNNCSSVVVQVTAGPQQKALKDRVVFGCKELGAEVDKMARYSNRASLLVALPDSVTRSEKYLAFIAARKAVVSEQYVLDSVSAGRWLDSASYYQGSTRAGLLRNSPRAPFSGWRVMLDEGSMREEVANSLRVVLEAGEAELLDATEDNLADATHLLTSGEGDADVIRVRWTRPEPPQRRAMLPKDCKTLRSEYLFQYLNSEREGLEEQYRLSMEPVWVCNDGTGEPEVHAP